MIDHSSQSILCVATSAGKTHDFALYKNSRLAVSPTLELLADTGYQGMDKLHPNSLTPHKKSKHHQHTTVLKPHNRALTSRRSSIEHVLRTLKRFRIFSSTYRNLIKRFGLRVNILSTIANLHRCIMQEV